MIQTKLACGQMLLSICGTLALVVPAVAQQPEPAARVERDRATGRATVVRAAPGSFLPVAAAPGREATPGDFLAHYGREFGLRNAAAELSPPQRHVDSIGMTHTSYKQIFKGVPVFSGVLRVHQDARGRFTAANGRFQPVRDDLNVAPAIDKDSAVRAATGQLAVNAPMIEKSELVIVDPGWYGDPPIGARLAYHVIVTDFAAGVREAFFIDAHSGKTLDRWNLLESVKVRVVIDDVSGNVVRSEGGPATGDPDSDAAYDYAGDTYDYLFRAFGRDSIDGSGATLNATVHLQSTSCPNAFGGPFGTFYCSGVVTDDIVAHEFGHGLTAFTADLIYQNQPGQLNESFSDVIGEVVDLLNGDAAFAGAPGGTPWPAHGTGPGTDEPNDLRMSCQADAFVTVNSPPGIAGDYAAQPASFGPALPGGGLSADLVIADAIRACNADMPFVNAGAMAGKIVLTRRGDCTFVEKVLNAQNAGAVGVIIMNNVAGGPAPMGGSSGAVTIPSLGITLADGDLLIAQGGAINVTMRSNESPAVRWLVGEDSAGFGGAIRDMWQPSCAGHPDTANHPFQTCSPTDNGGVHSGSGVPNHAFAILVDGNDFNGQSVNGIGLFKAAAVWYRALTVYLTPSSNFEDAFIALDMSAADLVGTMIKDPRDGSNYAVFTLADAVEVNKATTAVEMNTEGLCGSSLNVLDPTPPTICDGLGDKTTVFFDNFEGGVNGWAVANSAPPTPYNWVQTGGLPLARPGIAWFADDPSIGDCNFVDESGVHQLTSPAVVMPGGVGPIHVMFTHWLETENFFDGGNLKLSINGGPFQIVPKSAYQHNKYNATLSASGNTNPLAGQDAWTGTSIDGPQWGVSVADLSGLVSAGDSVRFRFDFGKDGCTGITGWYVDDFEVFHCGDAAIPPPGPDTQLALGRNRFISMTIPSELSGSDIAIRVRLESLHHPTNPPPGTPDFSGLEGEYRYVNSFGGTLVCPDAVAHGTSYACAQLGCQPEYRDWAGDLGGVFLHVTGDAVVPSSSYQVSIIDSSCGAAPAADTCFAGSPEVVIPTARWGDLAGSGGGPPDTGVGIIDLGNIVDKLKDLPTALPEHRLWLKSPNVLTEPINIIDVGMCVDAIKSFPYPLGIAACP